MSSDVPRPMRLRLRVKRHGLPATNVTWPVEAANGGHGPSGLSVAQLLEQVNEVIPLESDDWGLDDYAVEVQGFECLHFQDVNRVLRDGDTVDILPLSSTDLQLRKFSGRHQISADGRHLVDGIAFGRPNVRRPGARPPVTIPPRRRRRLLQTEDTDEGTARDAGRTLLIQDKVFELYDQDDSESDDSFREGEDSQSEDASEHIEVDMEDAEDEAAEELGRLSPAGIDKGRNTRALRTQRRTEASRSKPGTMVYHRSQLLDLVDDDGKPFPGVYQNDLLDQYQNASRNNATSTSPSQPPQSPTLSYQGPGTHHTEALSPAREISQSSISPASHKSKKGVSFEDGLLSSDNQRARSSGPSELGYDSELGSGSGLDAGSDSLMDETDDSNDTWTSSALSSASTTSSSASSSSSTSSSEEEQERPSRVSNLAAVKNNQSKFSGTETQLYEESKAMPQRMNPPGMGTSATAARNQRRRRQKKLDHLKRIGRLASTATLEDLQQWELSGNRADDVNSDRISRGPRSTADNDAVEFDRRRQELLASIESGGVDLAADGQEKRRSPIGLKHQGSSSGFGSGLERNEEQPQEDHPPATQPNESVQKSAEEPSQRRTKLDIAGSRRMVFNSLGLRVPKTKEDEDKLRSKHDVSRRGTPSLNGNAHEQREIHGSASADASGRTGERNPDTFDDSWKEKIILSAVECSEEGIALSTPPFPFVQRWDPQQQVPKGGRRKGGKKRKRNQAQYYENDEQWYGGEDTGEHAGLELDHNEPNEDLPNKAPRRTNTDVVDEAVFNQVKNGPRDLTSSAKENFSNEEDLPAMPADPETCVGLQQADICPKAIIGFRQLIMTDNWQPQISGFRTARVEKFFENGIVQMTLAKRDREKKQRTYDEDGQRVYGKFEMPDDEESQVSDGGLLEMPFADLIEPKLVQADAPIPMQTEAEPPGEDDVQNGQQLDDGPEIHMASEAAAGDDSGGLFFESDGVLESAEKANLPEAAEPENVNQVSIASNQDVRDSPARNSFALGSPMFHGLDLGSLFNSSKSSRNVSISITAGTGTQLQAAPGQLDESYEQVSAPRSNHSSHHSRLPSHHSVEQPSPADEGFGEGLFVAEEPSLADDDLGDGLFVKETLIDPLATKAMTPMPRTQMVQQDFMRDLNDVDANSSGTDLPSPSKIFAMSYTSSQSVKKERASTAISPPPTNSNSQAPSATMRSSRFPVTLTHFDFPESDRPIHQQSPSEIIDLTQSSDEAPTMGEEPTTRLDQHHDRMGLPRGPGWISKAGSESRHTRRLGGPRKSRI